MSEESAYKVLVNSEEQYCIWPAELDVPGGWNDIGEPRSKAECLTTIRERWTDMRPLSLRKTMEETTRGRVGRGGRDQADDVPTSGAADTDGLVTRLTRGRHPIVVGPGPDATAEQLGAAVARGTVHIRLTGTRGGTDLSFALDRQRSDVSEADFDNERGQARLIGELTLDFARIRCFADIDVADLAGKCRFERLDED